MQPAEEALQAALQGPTQRHREGRLDEALAGYAGVAQAFPGEPEPHFRMGLVEAERGALAPARQAIDRALALAERPHYLVALGDVLDRLGSRPQAIAAWSRAATLQPALWPAHARLGVALQEEGRQEEALAHCGAVAELRPQDPGAWNNLAAALVAIGRPGPAEAASRRAIELDPGHASAHFNLGRALLAQDRARDGLAPLERAVLLDPRFAGAWDSLGSARRRTGDLAASREAYERAVSVDPARVGPRVHLAEVLVEIGLPDEAVEAYAGAEERAGTGAAAIGSSRLFAMQFSGRRDRDEVFAEHVAWAARHAPAPRADRAFANDPRPERRLRIGYLSPRFHRSSAAFIHAAVIASHDPGGFQVHCYAEQEIEDEVSARLRASGAAWTRTRGLSDEALAAGLRADGIDIAIDLAGHTPDSRLLALAHGAAPVVGTWLDYFNTTGLDAVDFLVTDELHSPPGDGQRFVERVVRLPSIRLCWEPPGYAPDAIPVRLQAGRPPVFGAFCRMAKISPATRHAWCELLRRVPGSRLVIKNSAAASASSRAIAAGWFAGLGIDPARIEWRGASDHATMLREYLDVDVVLDTFPYNGGVTTLEALWMGRPVVTVSGDTLIGRQSKAMLAAIGLADRLCAPDAARFVETAAALVADAQGLSGLSASLRERVRRSRLVDTAAFTRDLEALLRGEWRRWCTTREPS